MSKIPPRIYNWGLTVLLVLVGITCWKEWGPVHLPGDIGNSFRDCETCPALALFQGGKFKMGSTDPAWDHMAKPHDVSVKPFYMGKFELTYDQYNACAIDKACPTIKADTLNGSGQRPIFATRAESRQYLAWLSKKTGKSYRLPSEAEWEYAARGGTTTEYFFGASPDDLGEYAWTGKETTQTKPVGLKRPNPYGMFDILGNQAEWVEDCYAEYQDTSGMVIMGGDESVANRVLPKIAAPTDGSARTDCGDRAKFNSGEFILRGGSFQEFRLTSYRSASRKAYDDVGRTTKDGVTRVSGAGIRVVRDYIAGETLAATPSGDGTRPDGWSWGTGSWIWSFLGTGFTGWVFKWEFILIGLPLIYTLLRNSASWTASAPKNIVINLDGTSNTPDQIEMGFAAQTNVFKLFKMLKVDEKGGYAPKGEFDASLCKKYDGRQIAFYYAGVGNKYDSDPVLQTLGMATGMGAAEIVERAYLDLVRVYQPGDRIFITGFSRGAAIARLLARAIDARGAPRSVWTVKLFGKHRTLWTSPQKKPMPIEVLGCWDTVGAFGVAKTIAGINFQKLNAFKDLTIPDNVAKAYHMVALDEQRDSFEPTLMDPDPIRPERIVEVWFSGDHANIGGGWATDKLSDITLDFLLARVSSGYATIEGQQPGGDESWGLYLSAKKCQKADVADRIGSEIDGVSTLDPDPLGQVRQWFSNLYIYRPRKLPLHAVISETVFERMTKSMPVYAPQSLFDLNDALDEKRDLIDEKVAKLAETNSLNENERQRIIAFKEKLRLMRWPKYWSDVVAKRKPRKIEDILSNEAANLEADESELKEKAVQA